MRLGSVIVDGAWLDVAVREPRYLPLETGDPRLDSILGIAAGGAAARERIHAWVDAQPSVAWRALDGVERIGPPIQHGAIYTIGANYRAPGDPPGQRPTRPLVYGKVPTSVLGQDGVIAWDRALTANVDAECELGVVLGALARRVDATDAMGHVFGYTVVNDVSSRDPWLDGDQWLLGKSMDGFCPVGPWIVTADEVAPDGLRLGCTLNGTAIQNGTTADMRFAVAEIVAFLSRHVTLVPGDLIATGTPVRLADPPGPDRHLEPGDAVTAWIEGIGELTSHVA